MKETVKLMDGSEVEIDCRHITGRRAFKLSKRILNITSLRQDKDGSVSMDCETDSTVDVCWDEIVAPSPQKEQVIAEDMQRIYEKYGKDQVDYALKKNLENLSFK